MNIGTLFGRYSILLAILLFAFFIIILFLTRTDSGKTIFGGFLIGKKISEKFAISTFASSLSLMLSSGLNMDLAFDLSSQAITDRTVKSKIEKAGHLIREGSVSFVDAIEKVGLLSNTMTGLLGTGHKTGSADLTLKYISEVYEGEYQNALMRRVSLIEPISILVITILIGSILTTVMFPLIGVLSAIG
ncbi:MAG: type II secretion system F family protein [Anaerovoracaceae bacterium]|jgi:type IV pilus assembly protein PilC